MQSPFQLFLFVLFLCYKQVVVEAARCQAGPTGPCPTFTNITTNNACPTGGVRFTCTNGQVGYACNGQQGPQGVRGPLPSFQALHDNSSCTLVLGDQDASIRLCNGSQGIQGNQGIQGIQGPPPTITALSASSCIFVAGTGSATICNGTQGIQGNQGAIGPAGPPPTITAQGSGCALVLGTGSASVCNGTKGDRGDPGPALHNDYHGFVNDSFFASPPTFGPLLSKCVLGGAGTRFNVIVSVDQRNDHNLPVFFVGGVFAADLAGSLLIYDCDFGIWDRIGTFLGVQGDTGATGAPGATGAAGADGPAPLLIQLDTGNISCPNGGVAIHSPPSSIDPVFICDGATGAQGVQGQQGIQGVQGNQGVQGIQGVPPTVTSAGTGCALISGTGSATLCNGTTGATGAQGIQGIQGVPPTISSAGTGCSLISGTGSSTICNGTQGIQGIQGIQGVQGVQGNTGQAGTNATFKTGNVIYLDNVYGNDANCARETPSARCATFAKALSIAVAGDIISIGPGIYTETPPLTIPDGVSISGPPNTRSVTIRVINLFTSVNFITMGENVTIMFVNFQLTSTQHIRQVGVYFPGTTTLTSRMRKCTVTMDNSQANSTGTSDIIGVLSNGTGTPLPHQITLREVTIVINSVGLGNKRGILVASANTIVTRNTDCYIHDPTTSSPTGSFIGMETTNSASAAIYALDGVMNGATADISQTSGSITLVNTRLHNAQSNGLGFTNSGANMADIKFADTSGITSNSVRFYRPNMDTITTTERTFSVPRNCIVKSMYVSLATAPSTGANCVWTLRRGIGIGGAMADTILTTTIADTATTGQDFTHAVHFDKDDRMALKIAISAANTATGSVIWLEVI